MLRRDLSKVSCWHERTLLARALGNVSHRMYHFKYLVSHDEYKEVCFDGIVAKAIEVGLKKSFKL